MFQLFLKQRSFYHHYHHSSPLWEPPCGKLLALVAILHCWRPALWAWSTWEPSWCLNNFFLDGNSNIAIASPSFLSFWTLIRLILSMILNQCPLFMIDASWFNSWQNRCSPKMYFNICLRWLISLSLSTGQMHFHKYLSWTLFSTQLSPSDAWNYETQFNNKHLQIRRTQSCQKRQNKYL